MDYEQPTKYLVHSTNYNGNEFDIPVLTAGKTFILGYTKETNYFDKEEIILFDDFTTDMKLVKFRFMLKSSAAKILKIKNKSNNISYIYNLLIKNRPERIGHNRHWISYTSQEYRFICNINEQSKIAKFLSLLDKQIELYVSKLALTEVLIRYYNIYFYDLCNKNGWIKLSSILEERKCKPIDKLDGYTPINIMLNGKGFKKSSLNVVLSKKGRKYYERYSGDLIIGLQNFHNGSVDVLNNDFIKPIMSNAIASFQNISCIPTILIKQILLNYKHQNYLKNIADGTGQKEFSINKILDSKIPNPNILQLDKWKSFFDNINKYSILIKNKLDELNKTKKYYLNSLFI